MIRLAVDDYDGNTTVVVKIAMVGRRASLTGRDCFRDFQKVRASTLDTKCAWRADFKGNADGRKNLKRDPLILWIGGVGFKIVYPMCFFV